MRKNSYKWAASGDINAFFGLVLDNLAGLILAVTMLATVFGFPVNFAIRYMVPGTAIGVLVGDLLYFGLAFWLARRTQRTDVTAMPLGLDTPSLIGMVLFVLGPAFVAGRAAGMAEEEAARQAWQIGICAVFLTGAIKFVLAFGSNWLRRTIPRAGLLGSLAAIALVLIAFLQVPKLFALPLVGLPALMVILISLVGRVRLPFGIPGALASVGLGCLIWYVAWLTGLLPAGSPTPKLQLDWAELSRVPTEWLTVFDLSWWSAWPKSLEYVAYVIPFAITTVIGGIDCTESAAAAGDEYPTGTIIGVEAVATMVAAVCGGVIQTTPYIGQPAYKAMGARAAYTLATALFIGAAGVLGFFQILFDWIPEAAVLPMLVFIGLEITSQSFQATPRRHYAALGLACMPALAKLLMIVLPRFVEAETLSSNEEIRVLAVLSGGFIITSLGWASAMALIIDRRFVPAAIFLLALGICSLCGAVHSPLPGDRLFAPWDLFGESFRAQLPTVARIAGAYFLMALIVWGMEFTKSSPDETLNSDEEYEALA